MKQILIFGSFIFLLSCSVSKRKYMTGYHVDWNKSTVKTQNKAKQNKIQQQSKHLSEPKQSELIAGADNKLALSPIKKTVSLIKSEDSCDVLILTDGTETKVKILEVNESEIKYKTCNYINGPTRVINKSSAFMIKFSNGTIQTFKTKNLHSQNTNNLTKKIEDDFATSDSTNMPKNAKISFNQKTNPYAKISLVLAIISAILTITSMIILIWPIFGIAMFFAALGGFFSLVAKGQIKDNPNNYTKGSKDATKIGGLLCLFILIFGLFVYSFYLFYLALTGI